MLAELLDAAGIANTPELPCHASWPPSSTASPKCIGPRCPSPRWCRRATAPPTSPSWPQAGEPFFGSGGFLAGPAWQRLQKPLDLEGTRFYRPNAGVLYPALYALLDRLAASAKSVRAAPQRPDGGEQGYRCDLTGEAEWLTHDLAHLSIPKGERKHADTLGNRAISKRPGLSRKGEHLGALAMLKRLWAALVRGGTSWANAISTCAASWCPPTPWRCPPRWSAGLSKARRSATPAASCW